MSDRCDWCDKVISLNELTVSEGKSYHALCLEYKTSELLMIEDMIKSDKFNRDVPEYDALEELERVFNKAVKAATEQGKHQAFEVVCAKCGKNKVEDKWIHKTDNGFQVTHTFCPECCNETRKECYGTNDL